MVHEKEYTHRAFGRLNTTHVGSSKISGLQIHRICVTHDPSPILSIQENITSACVLNARYIIPPNAKGPAILVAKKKIAQNPIDRLFTRDLEYDTVESAVSANLSHLSLRNT